MKKPTFGVTSSPFIATQVLGQVAEDYKEAYSEPARLINENFYVDDVLMGTFTIEEATQIRTGLNSLLKEAGMTLRKWRSSSTEVLVSIPEELKEKEDLHISTDTTLKIWGYIGTLVMMTSILLSLF